MVFEMQDHKAISLLQTERPVLRIRFANGANGGNEATFSNVGTWSADKFGFDEIGATLLPLALQMRTPALELADH